MPGTLDVHIYEANLLDGNDEKPVFCTVSVPSKTEWKTAAHPKQSNWVTYREHHQLYVNVNRAIIPRIFPLS
jgi:hypothetical protein